MARNDQQALVGSPEEADDDAYAYEDEGFEEDTEGGAFDAPEEDEAPPVPDHPLPASNHAEHMDLVDGRRLRPTPRLWVLFGVAAMLGVGAAVLAFGAKLYVLAYVTGGIAALIFLTALFTSFGVRSAAKNAYVDVQRSVETPKHLAVGDLITVTLDASACRFGGGRVRIRETPTPGFLPLEPAKLFRTGSVTYRMRASQRGKQKLRGIDVLLTDGLGLWLQERRYRLETEVEVHPGTHALGLRAQIMGQMAFQEGTPKAMKHIFREVEIENQHDYGPGDRMKDVDWKLYGRTGQMVVREKTIDTSTHALLMFDCGTSMTMPRRGKRGIDVAFEMAHEIIASATDRTIAVGYLAFNDTTAIDRMMPSKSRGLSRAMVERFNYITDPIAQKRDKDPSRELMRNQNLDKVLTKLLKSGLGPKTSILIFTDLDTVSESILQILAKVAQGGVKTGVVLFPAPTYRMKRSFRLSGGKAPNGFRGKKLRKEMRELFVAQQIEFLDLRHIFGDEK